VEGLVSVKSYHVLFFAENNSSKITSFSNVGRRKTDDRKSIDGYVKRGDRYRHTLDTGESSVDGNKLECSSKRLELHGRLLALPVNIRLGLKSLTMTNSPAGMREICERDQINEKI